MTALGSMQYTIGTALERAREGGSYVEVLVDNTWLSGQVVASDGIGVVLDNHGQEHCVIRLEAIAAVRVCTQAPMLRPIPSAPAYDPGFGDTGFDDMTPMPGPRIASA